MKPSSVRLRIKVVPGSSRDSVAGWLGETLKLKVAAPPEKGRANEAVCRLLAGTLGVGASCVQVVAGHQSTIKSVVIEGLEQADVFARLPESELRGESHGL